MKKKTMVLLALFAVLLFPATLASAQAVPQPNDTLNFTDLSGHWAQAAVQKLVEKGAVPFSGDTFAPDKAISRSEFAVMLYKTLDIHIEYLKAPDIKDYFIDVKQDAPYASALIDLVTANIIDEKGSFRPDAPLTREEMVHYIMNAYRYKMGDSYKMVKIESSSFQDNNEISPSYRGDVALSVYLKLIQGTGNHLFRPTDHATRAQAAVATTRLLDLLQKENPQVVVQPSATLKNGSLELKLCITNHSTVPLILLHTSGQQFDFVLLDADKKVLYTWSDGRAFTMALTTTVIEAGKSTEFVEVLNKEIYNNIKDKAVYLKAYVIGRSDAFHIMPEGYEIRINEAV